MNTAIIRNRFYWLYLIGFFIILTLPLLSIPPWFEPPSWGKTIVFRSLLAVLFFIFLVKQKIDFQNIKEIFNPHSKIFLPFSALLAYFCAVFISTLLSLDFSNSLWGTPERGGGFVNFSFYVLFCIFGFLIIKNQDWKKLLDFSLIIGFLVILIAVFQKFGIFSQIFTFIEARPSSTLGNPIILSLFLLPLLFLALSFFILEKNKVKKYLYLFFLIFCFFAIVFLTQGRAAFLGLLVGFFWFFIAYPKKMKVLKIGVVFLLGLIFLSLFILNNNPQIYEKWYPVFKEPISRIATLAEGLGAESSRVSVWKISARAFLEKPYFGYGPENFIIAFYKYYDPLLPQVKMMKFDKSHNSLIEILITSGIFALFFYLVFFFSIFWRLQKIKGESPVSHGLQSAFLAYFVASLASIEGFSNFLIFFFFASYSLYLISSNDTQKNTQNEKQISTKIWWKAPVNIFLFFALVLFLWQYNFMPFQTNTKINIAKSLTSNGKWQESYEILEKESQRKSFLLPYLNSVYLNLLVDRASENPEERIFLSEKIAEISEKNAKIQPYNTQNWLRLGESLIVLAKEKQEPETVEKAKNAFEKAIELSPKNQTILLSSFFGDISAKDFRKAEEKSDFCLKTFPEIPECLWLSGIIKIYLNDIEKGKNFIEKAKEKGYPTENENSLNQLAMAYLENKNYKEMLPIYQKLISINGSQVQYKTSLAILYKELKQYDKARELASEIIKTNPELKIPIEEFLRTLYQ